MQTQVGEKICAKVNNNLVPPKQGELKTFFWGGGGEEAEKIRGSRR